MGNPSDDLHDTTKEHYDLFCEECKRLVNMWGLTDWKVYFEHVSLEGDRADCTFDSRGCVATLRFSKEWNSAPTIEGVKSSALHEILHLCLARLSCLARYRFLSPDDLDKEEERLVHILHSIIAGKDEMFEISPSLKEPAHAH